jgi:hypothetical protein
VYLGNAPHTDPVETFTGLTMDPTSSTYVHHVVATRSRYITAVPVADPSSAEAGTLTGGDLPPTGQILDEGHRHLQISLNGDGFQEVDLTGDDVSSAGEIRERLEHAVKQLLPLRDSTTDNPYQDATVTLEGEEDGPKHLKITSGNPGPGSSVRVRAADEFDQDAARLLGLAPGRSTSVGASALRPTVSGKTRYLIGDGTASEILKDPEKGTDGDAPQATDYINGLRTLDTVRDISLIAIPGIGDEAVVKAGMNYCKVLRPLSDCFFIADLLPQDQGVEAVQKWQKKLTANAYGAAYYPWVKMPDPLGGAEPVTVPPSGFVAGVYARTDNQRGVWKTPAGTQASVAGVVGLVDDLTDVDHGTLNLDPNSVCAIRHFPASGTVIWGGRTLSGDDTEWRYISPRRMAIFLRKSIFDGIQWAVFEPNDEPLWAQLRLNLNAFMTTLFRKGAFQGSTPDQAFYVKVDNETTQQADIDDGVVNIHVGFAPLKPSEFVVVQLAQKAGQLG